MAMAEFNLNVRSEVLAVDRVVCEPEENAQLEENLMSTRETRLGLTSLGSTSASKGALVSGKENTDPKDVVIKRTGDTA